MIDVGITPKDMTAIWVGAAWMLLAAAIGAGATVIRAVLSARFSQGMAFDIRNDLFSKIETLAFGNLDHMQTGQLITREVDF